MPVTNYLLENAGKAVLRGQAINSADYFYFAGSDNTFNGNETEVVNDYFHKTVGWVSEGIDSKFTIELGLLECTGSYIAAVGLIDDNEIGSGTPCIILPSDIGLKSSNFTVEIEGKILFRRPL